MRVLDVISFLLLIGGQERTDLAHRAVDHCFRLLHCVTMDRDQLRFRLIQDRLNLSLLIRCQVERLSHVIERIVMPAAVPTLGNRKAGGRHRTRGQQCY